MAERKDHKELGAHLFRFAAISDTHVNPSDHVCNSPFPVNARANRRFRHVVSELNQRDLDFVLHLGDLVHPVPSSGEAYVQAAQAYREIVADLTVPIHVIPGNHDIGDKPGDASPVPTISASDITSWENAFGAHYGSFTRDGVRFVLLNAQLINSGLPEEEDQQSWAEAIFETDQRTVLALHHPPFICAPDEPDHYDNLQQPGRDWVLNLAAKSGVALMLAGHAHNFWYDRVAGADYYRLPAISFVRQDYAEMLRAAPSPDTEFGRDDAAKLGYMIVDVFEHGHAAQINRTFGVELAVGETGKSLKPTAPPPRVSSPMIGFDLRQNWAEITEIAPSGALDEFDRKPARNDYPLMGLIEMGVQRLRIPLADLRDPIRRQRLHALAGLGFKPTLFCLGMPQDHDLFLIEQSPLDSVEIALPLKEIFSIERLPSLGLPVFVTLIHEHSEPSGGVHKHTIEHGLKFDDAATPEHLAKLRDVGAVGAVFRAFASGVTVENWATVLAQCTAAELVASLHVRTGATSPASEVKDSFDTVSALESIASEMPKETRIFIDTLVTQDRGYFPRPGALTSSHNPTLLSAAISMINSR